MATQKKLSLCILTKDEDSFLSDCIENMEGTADEIIVADLGSGSRTPELAKQAGAAVYQPAWEDDFCKIKNFCMDRATGDWVLFLRVGETIPREQHSELRVLMLNPAAEGYLMNVDDRREKQEEACPAQSLRLLRNRKNYRFRYRSFEYIPDEELYSILSGSIEIIRDMENTSRWQTEERIRLLKIDLKERPQDGYVRYLQGVELLNQGKYKESAASFELARHALCGGYLYAPHLYKCLGICLLALSRNEAAEEVLAEGFWLFPFYTDLMVLRAELYRGLDRDAEALKCLEICVAVRNAYNVCVPEPQIDISAIEKMREKIMAGRKEKPVEV
jgi:glycosyltransferase involved in cell wall biosynthesis